MARLLAVTYSEIDGHGLSDVSGQVNGYGSPIGVVDHIANRSDVSLETRNICARNNLIGPTWYSDPALIVHIDLEPRLINSSMV